MYSSGVNGTGACRGNEKLSSLLTQDGATVKAGQNSTPVLIQNLLPNTNYHIQVRTVSGSASAGAAAISAKARSGRIMIAPTLS